MALDDERKLGKDGKKEQRNERQKEGRLEIVVTLMWAESGDEKRKAKDEVK